MSLEFDVYVANDAEWEAYKVKFGKTYAQEEEAQKRSKWEETIEHVNKHNQEYKDGKQTYTVGVNQFADGTQPSFGLLKPNAV